MVPAVCAWWRAVALEGDLFPELNLCPLPIFALRATHLPGFAAQRDSFLAWLRPRAHSVRGAILQAERWEVRWGGGRAERAKEGQCGRH